MTDLYKEAARIVHRANLKEGSLKTLVYSSSYGNLRKLFALVSESIKYQSVLRDVLGKCDPTFLNEEMINNDHDLAVVLLYELLIGNKFGHAGFVRKTIRKYEAGIKTVSNAVLKEKNMSSFRDVLKEAGSQTIVVPRYSRVNLIKCNVDDAIEKLYDDGWEYIGKLSIDRFKDEAASLTASQFGLDPLLDDVLVFPAQTDLHDHFLVKEGVLVLQDKASCVPAHVLSPPAGSVVLDCCAAPGNKTSHLASLMKDNGQIIALDRDSKRMTTMKSLLQRYGAHSVETIVQDFLTLSPQSEDVSSIDMILVDPSCSGSGMHESHRPTTDVNARRLDTLKRFQISLLKHALRFPNVQKVVYSTCSIHSQENEEVVEEVMSNVHKHFDFIPVMPEWPDSRGLQQFKHHHCFLRLSSEKHLTTGFFVACFKRKDASKCDNEKEKGAFSKKSHKESSQKNSINNEAVESDQCVSEDRKKTSNFSVKDDLNNEHSSKDDVKSLKEEEESCKRKEEEGSFLNSADSTKEKKKEKKKKHHEDEYFRVNNNLNDEHPCKESLKSVTEQGECTVTKEEEQTYLNCTNSKKEKKKKKKHQEDKDDLNDELSCKDSLKSSKEQGESMEKKEDEDSFSNSTSNRKEKERKKKKKRQEDKDEIFILNNDMNDEHSSKDSLKSSKNQGESKERKDEEEGFSNSTYSSKEKKKKKKKKHEEERDEYFADQKEIDHCPQSQNYQYSEKKKTKKLENENLLGNSLLSGEKKQKEICDIKEVEEAFMNDESSDLHTAQRSRKKRKKTESIDNEDSNLITSADFCETEKSLKKKKRRKDKDDENKSEQNAVQVEDVEAEEIVSKKRKKSKKIHKQRTDDL